MGLYKGRVRIWAELVVEGEDKYDADERAQALDDDALASLIDWDTAYYEVFPHDFPNKIG